MQRMPQPEVGSLRFMAVGLHYEGSMHMIGCCATVPMVLPKRQTLKPFYDPKALS